MHQLEFNQSDLLNRYNLNKNSNLSKYENINYLANKDDISQSIANATSHSKTAGNNNNNVFLTSSLLSYEGINFKI